MKKPIPAWTPFALAESDPEHPARVRRILLDQGADDFEIEDTLAELARTKVYINSRFQVHVQELDDSRSSGLQLTWLSIKNRDKSARHDWRDFQRLKTELLGADVEGIEIYPAEDRVVDTCNQWHLICFQPGQRVPFGYQYTHLSEKQNEGGSQRPFEKNSPWKTDARLDQGQVTLSEEEDK